MWAEQDRSQRFYDLSHLLYDRDGLRLAHAHVAHNAGSMTAGCDGVTMALFDENLEGNLHQLAQELQSETFEPYPVRRVDMLKSEGRHRCPLKEFSWLSAGLLSLDGAVPP